MLIKRYKSVTNKEFFDISEVGMDGILEGLSKKDLISIIDNLCNVMTDEELLKLNHITEWHLFHRSADDQEREALNEGLIAVTEGTEGV